jgi:glycosyltransferase involved in cell wall biosynthesis
VNRADLVLFISRTQMRLLRNVFCLSDRKTEYLPLTLSRDLFKGFRLTKAQAKSRLGISKNSKVVVYSGASWWIGEIEVNWLPDLLKAMKLVLRVHTDALLLLNGLSPYRETKLQKIVSELGITDRVRFLGSFELGSFEHYCCLTAADLLVLPVSSVPISLTAARHKTMYYLASGKPIVATWTPEISTTLEDGKHAILVQAEDVALFAEAIIGLFSNPQTGLKLAEAAKRKFEQELCTEAVASAIRNTLERICD